jgi:Zn-dependent peptidase ImmA (M78 family)/transcriptional regulator with XRE-family HTH domain
VNSLEVVRARPFQPARLKAARQLGGLSQRKLAEEIGLSPAGVSQIESGSVQPSSDVVDRLSMALRFRPSFFYRPMPSLGLEKPFFRSRRSTPTEERNRAFAFAGAVAEVGELIEAYVEMPPSSFQQAVSIGRNASLSDIEGAAENLRMRWGIDDGPVPNVIRLLEAHGAIVVAVGVFDRRLDAFSIRGRNRPIVVLCSDGGNAARRRFDAAHELGHLALHLEPSDQAAWQEEQAHKFASALLMPAARIAPWLPSKSNELELLEEGSRIWGVSMQALLFRARDLNVLSEDSYRRAMRRLSAAGWRTSEPVDMGPAEAPELIDLAVRALPEAGGSLEGIATELGLPMGRLRRMISLPENASDLGGEVVPLQTRVA